MFLDRTVPEMFLPMATSLENLCSILLEPLKGDNIHWGTEALRPLLKCQSHDLIVTARTCTGNASPSEIPSNHLLIPILNEPRRAEAPSTPGMQKTHGVSS